MQLETGDLTPGDNLRRIVEIDDGGAALTGYTVEALLADVGLSTAITSTIQLVQQGNPLEWELDMPSVETDKVPNVRGTVTLQVRAIGAKTQTGTINLTVKPRV